VDGLLNDLIRALCVEDLRKSQLLRAVFALIARIMSPNLPTQDY
jgi:hypothetical protein